MSFSSLMIKRPGYLYFYKRNGEEKLHYLFEEKRYKIICEFINFWIFDLKLLPKEDNKASVIKSLREFNRVNNKYFGILINLNYLNKKFIPYENLLKALIEDPFVSKEDKEFLNKLNDNYKNKFFTKI